MAAVDDLHRAASRGHRVGGGRGCDPDRHLRHARHEPEGGPVPRDNQLRVTGQMPPVLGQCQQGRMVAEAGVELAHGEGNLAVTGAALAARERGMDRPVIGCSAVEHVAVLEPVRAAGGDELAVDHDGVIDLAGLEEWLAKNSGRVAEVSVMLVNNETGVIQPVTNVSGLVRDLAPGALVHSDAVQALGWLDVAGMSAEVDLLTMSAHKIGGPKGAGALLVRSAARSRVRPVLRGGPQERELRAGTHGVADIVGMACAARLCSAERDEATQRVAGLADSLVAGLLAEVERAEAAVPRDLRIGAICNVWFDGVEAEELLVVLDELGVCASAGSACASGALEPSHVLLAMGRSRDEAGRHVRYSLGRSTTKMDVDQAIAATSEAVARLRGAA